MFLKGVQLFFVSWLIGQEKDKSQYFNVKKYIEFAKKIKKYLVGIVNCCSFAT